MCTVGFPDTYFMTVFHFNYIRGVVTTHEVLPKPNLALPQLQPAFPKALAYYTLRLHLKYLTPTRGPIRMATGHDRQIEQYVLAEGQHLSC